MTTLETQVRRLVAEELGVDANTLAPDTLLADDLAADSLDLAELGCVLENELGVELEDHVMDALRTYGDLVGAVGRALWQRDTSTAAAAPESGIVVRACVAATRRPKRTGVIRAGRLDPYLVEVIAEDALRRGAGTVLEVRVTPEADDEDVGTVRAAFSWLADRGVRVHVGRDAARHTPTFSAA